MSGDNKQKYDLISIVVPAYNHEDYIDRCIDSIIAQTYENIELIIVNDGSPDNTAEKIKARAKECEKRFTRFVFIDKENEGQIKTFNKGCFEAKGKYLAIIASDDAYTPDAIETLHSSLSENQDYILAVGDNYIMDSEGKTCFWDKVRNNVYSKEEAKFKTFGDMLKNERKDVDFNSDEFGTYKSFLKGNYIPNGYLFNRDIFVNKIGGYSYDAPLEDYYLHLQLSKYGKYKYVEKPLFYYRWHDANTIKNNFKMVLAFKKVLLNEQKIAYSSGKKDLFDKYVSIKKDIDFKIPFIFNIVRFYTDKEKKFMLKLLGITLFEKIKTSNSKVVNLLYIPIVSKKRGE